MAHLQAIVIDSLVPSRLARFWADALTDYAVRPYDAAEITRLAERGLTPDSDPQVAVDGPGPTLWFQKTELPKSGRNRVHVDIESDDRAGEVARLAKLGARVRDTHEGFTVMLDPEDNEFCVIDPSG